MSIKYCTFPCVSERWYDSRLLRRCWRCSLEGELVNSRAPEIAIYLRTYLRASFQRKALLLTAFRIQLVVLYEQTENIAATKIAWTVVFNGREASGPLIQIVWLGGVFWRPKGGSTEPPRTPTAYGRDDEL